MAMNTIRIIPRIILTMWLTFPATPADSGAETPAARGADAAAESSQAGPQRRRTLEDYASITERGLFGEGRGAPAGAANGPLNYRLIGTVEGGGFTGAVLEEPGGQAFYAVNQKLPDGSEIVKVSHDRITIRRADGGMFDLMISSDATNAAPPPVSAETAARKRDKEISPADRDTSAPAVPARNEVPLTPAEEQEVSGNVEKAAQALKNRLLGSGP